MTLKILYNGAMVLLLLCRARTPCHAPDQYHQSTNKRREAKREEREKIAVESGNKNALDNWFVIVLVYLPPTRVAVGERTPAAR